MVPAGAGVPGVRPELERVLRTCLAVAREEEHARALREILEV